MRSGILLFLLAAGCQTPSRDTILQRDREMLDLREKKKQAIFDLSEHPPTNGPDSYFQRQADRPR
jgi:hypothetical protein